MTDAIRTRSILALTFVATSLALSGCSLLGGSESATDPQPSATENSNVFTIQVGDCLNDGGSDGEVSEVPTVPCSEPHDSEAYASITMDDDEFPGQQAAEEQARLDCAAAFDDFVGLDYQSSTFDPAYYFPTKTSWANGDREILCLIVDPAGKVTGSLKGAAR